MHYKDGTEAQVGDLVKGTVYNTKGVITGVLLGITPGSDVCNARVALVTLRGLGDLRLPNGSAPTEHHEGTPHVHAVTTSDGTFTVHREYERHLFTREITLVGHKVDYTACKDLELVHREPEPAPVHHTEAQPSS